MPKLTFFYLLWKAVDSSHFTPESPPQARRRRAGTVTRVGLCERRGAFSCAKLSLVFLLWLAPRALSLSLFLSQGKEGDSLSIPVTHSGV